MKIYVMGSSEGVHNFYNFILQSFKYSNSSSEAHLRQGVIKYYTIINGINMCFNMEYLFYAYSSMSTVVTCGSFRK